MIVLSFVGLIWLLSNTQARQQPPHVLFILADDMGWNDVSFHGSDQILTPNLDMLAYNGVILKQYYTEAICTPARSALLTGKYPMRTGMQGMPLFNSEDRGIPTTERLLPSYMKELGYATHLVGKWHVGMSRQEYLPTARGYDSHYGMRGGFIDYYSYNKVETWPDGRLMFGMDLFDNDVPEENEERYILDALTDRTIKIIQQHNSSQPLFLQFTPNSPHAGNNGGALQPPLYRPIRNKHIANSDRRLYAEVVNHLDWSIGRVIEALDKKNILDNMLIVFASDNGAPTVGDFSNWGTNVPFRGKKQTPWEGAVRVPAFIWHASIKPKVWEGMMHITDWLPTLATAAGGKVNKRIDGVDQWEPILQNKDSNRREVLLGVETWSTYSYGAYRAGDYKIVLGNVSVLSNGYYGAEFLPNKEPMPNYLYSLQSCQVARVFEKNGIHVDEADIDAMRNAAVVRQKDTIEDTIPCIPTLTRGCLYNVRQDPSERHDLWEPANEIANILSARLRALWRQQLQRGPLNLQSQADPANFNYIWTPWITSSELVETQAGATATNQQGTVNLSIAFNRTRSVPNVVPKERISPLAACSGTTGLRSFFCILRSVF